MTNITQQTGLVNIDDSDTGEGLILIIIVISAFLLILFVTCGVIIYSYKNNHQTEKEELRELKDNYRRQVNRRISDMTTSIHHISETRQNYKDTT